MFTFLTWDTAILGTFGLLLAYSLLIRKHKSLATLVCVYIGYAISAALGMRIAEFFIGDRVVLQQGFIQVNASSFTVQSILMVLVAFLLSSFIKLGGKRSRYTAIEVVVYALATMALATMFVVSFMDPQMRAEVLKSSKIVPVIYNFREWILVAPVFIIIFFGIYSNPDE